ncbi:MAG: DUF4974 domain-containing protein [Prevotellaceae bacterium]|jgi:ferric-dicitrate binding protein FerR (iron transport regulator)|nr:DUF4974 domain-containing protein [Prevotellaceae bacterium]
MDRLDFRYKIAHLIAEELFGIIEDDDRAELEAWLNADVENRKEYEQILLRMKTEFFAKTANNVDVMHEWIAFKNRTAPKRINLKWLYGAAAAAIVAAAIFFYNIDRTEQPVAVAVVPEEIVKEHKAILVLDDGRRMNISDSANNVIVSTDGFQIATSGFRLQYQKEERHTELVENYNTLIVPQGAEYELMLSDSTVVWLNSGSYLTYPIIFDGDFRKVQMEGEICFNVAKQEDKPFIVTAGDVSVRVLGTLFNIEAYAGEPVVTTLVTGKIEVSSRGQSMTIEPDRQVTISAGQFDIKSVYANEFTEWTKGIFHFTKTPLSMIMSKLARWYDVEVIYSAQPVKNIKFSLEIKRYDNISSILSKIEKTGSVKFKIDGKKVFVENPD